MGIRPLRVTRLAGAAAALALLAACSGGSDNDGTITIGVALPTTGGSAVLGEPMTHGIEMAVNEINQAGGVNGAQLEIAQTDLGADDTDALNAFNLVTSENPAAVIGFPVSTQGFAVATQIERSAIPVIMGGTNSRVAGINDWVFSMTASDAITTRAAAQFAVESRGVQRIGLLRESGELGTGASEVLTRAAQDLGFELVDEQVFQSGDVDLSTQANALRDSGAEMLFVYGQQADYIVVANALAAAGMHLPTFIAGLQPGTYQELNQEGFETIYTRNQCIPTKDAEGPLGEWATRYEAQFSVAPTEYAAIAYDGMSLLADALTTAGSTEPDAIRDALTTLPESEGVCGMHVGTPEGALSFGVTIGHYEGGATVVDEQLTVGH